MLSSRVQVESAGWLTVIPVEVSRRLGLTPGAELFWEDDGSGGFRVFSADQKNRRDRADGPDLAG
ncbi:hypothetical protein [Longimicrobium terrae]|uniref:Bifunctional DNA-binding transcriptional regulator/antitoxin component of YhaV-PrlF toxin-antitoxin module n=1 Tax=Longimicrobium terrae TaxID=1639882 RepID=A0A841GWX3_9BACT|nr:hypothetical protein [Longimicrobium terrae]MBB4635501.1 bifunctional DNA-binding transcriptional regulator/antitoxin component of YhaV-PrlF toxin-antitoxin module [Longimicrobium terrae]MBB6069895.1 bifunctional DNA-binding transcriptional regulator/antitoxin component of YhaV-PrlF toxin-antitoxin module [Longimicrobium terrae]NNC32808.1 hypothetical protein [Longimicrobium terrae]